MMQKKLCFGLLLWVPCVFSNEVSETLQQKLNSIRTMSAHFEQVVTAKKREVSHSSGDMALSRPGRFRWQTKDPMEQLVVADGQKLWIYDVDLEQVTVHNQAKNTGGTAGLFLSGYNDTLTKDFSVSAKAQGSHVLYDLTALSKKANFSKMKLEFEGERLTGIELYDQLGQRTRVVLSVIKNNPKLASALFQFKPPKGADVIKQ